MEKMLLQQFNRLPEHLKTEVLHFIQFLVEKTSKPKRMAVAAKKEPIILRFEDFRFQEKGQTYSRSEIYGDNGR